ncbi:MAG: hypothetical protein A4E62_02664 [Syntrophorhabdus sp. PtaU1.Bin002]|nr:MAG: hypothetical protein A4E58_02104 [Syntrophorhabdus sp. PtaB.Bin006]OPY65560.1 MAG: hypothetical protein A4E62_02664 [Syntrophorhabdus sp. PtaU1.Bin002]
MEKRRNWLQFVAPALLLLNIVFVPVISAYSAESDVMEKRCQAVKEGTENDRQIKTICASYFEQADANPVTGVAVKTAPAPGITFNKVALISLGVGTGIMFLATTIFAP